MASDALEAYRADIGAGSDALLVCDTTEMADALNQRLHCDRAAPGTPTVEGARGHRIGVGDLILTRRNDPTITAQATNAGAGQVNPVRNGQRWRVAAIDAAANRVAAQRLEYVREHVSLGYAVTVHAAQGVTADTTHAVIGETGIRSLLYVAMTRGRHANTAGLADVASAGDSAHRQAAWTIRTPAERSTRVAASAARRAASATGRLRNSGVLDSTQYGPVKPARRTA
jgi:hypothetical protein